MDNTEREIPDETPRKSGFDRLVQMMAALRGTDGCPWDKVQTLSTLQPYVLEEACELIDAMEERNPAKIMEELGDLIFETVFVTQVCRENCGFDMRDVIDAIHEKMIRRHPHIFGSAEVDKPSEVLRQWHEIKADEKRRRRENETSVLGHIPTSLPALHKAQKVQRKASRVGFDWTESKDVLNKVEEEFRELRDILGSGDKKRIEEEFGDLFFALVNAARFSGVDAEAALRNAVRKFMRRFKQLEVNLTKEGVPLEKYTLEQMDAEWDRVKTREKRNHP
jgi:MazG family protein